MRRIVVCTPKGEWEGTIEEEAIASEVLQQVSRSMRIDNRDVLELVPWGVARHAPLPLKPETPMTEWPDCKYWVLIATGTGV